MKTADFIKACARSTYDRDNLVISAGEWLEILNFQSGEMSPEIEFRTNIEGTIASLNEDLQVNLGSYSKLSGVRDVYLLDEKKEQYPYDNWIYNKDTMILELDPESSATSSLDPSEYITYLIIGIGALNTITTMGDLIITSNPKLILLQKICIREALRRILFDHAKLDRYRTLVGRMNEYALMAMIRDYTTELELGKRKNVDTHPVRSF